MAINIKMELQDKLQQIISLSANEELTASLLTEEIAKDNLLKAFDNFHLGVSIESLGLTAEDLDNADNMHEVEENEVEEFAKSKTINLYRYVSHASSGYGGGDVGKDSRSFCKTIVRRTRVSLMRYVDILKLNGVNKGMGINGANVYNVFKWRGGVRCKHVWVKYVYNKETKSLVKAPRKDQPSQSGKGNVPNA